MFCLGCCWDLHLVLREIIFVKEASEEVMSSEWLWKLKVIKREVMLFTLVNKINTGGDEIWPLVSIWMRC